MLRCSTTAFHGGHRRLLLSSALNSLSLRSSIIAQKSLRPASFTTDTTATPTPSLASWRTQLLDTALTETVPKYGWTEQAIAQAVRQQQQSISLAAVGLVTVSDLVAHAMDQSYATLARDLETRDTTTHDLVSNLTWALQRRLECNLEYGETWHAAMAVGAQPSQARRTQQQLAALIDLICNTLQPSLTTTERLGLGAVYVAAELHLVGNGMRTPTSDDDAATTLPAATRDFLRQRVVEWDRLRQISLPLASSNGNLLWTMTHVGAALLSGAQSLVVPTTSRSGTSPTDYDRSPSIPPPPPPSKIV